MARVFVAMSGGVDSSVAAALLVEQGHDVTGVTMQIWPSSDEEGGCCSVSATRDAKRVCDTLGIPHYTLDFRDAFEREVIGYFADEYAAGRTPNPCVACNDRLKFADLLARVSLQGADALATGHYARITRGPEWSSWLSRGMDASKDQSYFLYRMTQAQLERTLFPVGELCKSEVRDIAVRMGLPTAAKTESQDTCFERAGSYVPVIEDRHPQALMAGDIVDTRGVVLGSHQGIARYTVGQRKGLGIGGLAEPLFVTSIDARRNRVVVGPREALTVTRVECEDHLWRGDPAGEPLDVMVRYRMGPVPAHVRIEEGNLIATFAEPLDSAVTGQALVCYRGDTVVGGGTISCVS